MREHSEAAKQDAAAPKGRTAGTPQGLPAAIGNRAMTRMVARLEASAAVDALKDSLAPGVLGAERRVVDTMVAMSEDPKTFGDVAKDYQQKVEAPLPPALGQVPAAAALIPQGWVPEPEAS